MGIKFNERVFKGFYDLYRHVRPQPAVTLNTAYSRYRRKKRTNGTVSNEDMVEILYFSQKKYCEHYRNRQTLVVVSGKKIVLNNYYDKFTRPSVEYSTFRQRVRGLESRSLLDHASIKDAIEMDQPTWISFYGGGRRRPFVYQGNLYTQLQGESFASVASFLRLIGQYENRSSVWSRLKSGWLLDDALSEPILSRYERKGKIYVVTNNITNQSYVGLTTYQSVLIRWRAHLSKASSETSTAPLHESIRKFGPKAFKIKIVEDELAQDDLPKREKYWINKLGTKVPNGFNVQPGGQMGGGRKKKVKYKKREFTSFSEACFVLSCETGLPEHVVLLRLQRGEKLPKKSRQASKHPDAGSNLWRRWKSLIKRAESDNYQGKVCERWLVYDNFKEDVFSGYSPGLRLCRITRSRPWGPKNFQWLQKRELVEWTHGNTYIIDGGKYLSLAAVSRAFGIGVTTLRDRIERQGMSIEEAVSKEIGPSSYRARKEKVVVDDNEFASINQAAKYASATYGISFHQARDRLRRGLELDRPPQAKACVVNGVEFKSQLGAAKHFGINKSTFGKRLTLGWTLEQALGLDAPPKRSKNSV